MRSMLRRAERPAYDRAVADEAPGTRRITDAEVAVWRSFLRAHARVVRRLEADLVAAHGLPLAWYDVLVQLVDAPDRRLRMTELADRVLLSRSGLTRLVDRLVTSSLVRREPSDTDARGSYAVLTDQGYERLRTASGTHLRGVYDLVISRFDARELEEFGRYVDRLAAD
jgi:DNA-binding MarR family transcriptional regulator